MAGTSAFGESAGHNRTVTLRCSTGHRHDHHRPQVRVWPVVRRDLELSLLPASVVVVVSSNQVAAFALAAFIVIVIPGPSVLFVIGRALAHGRRTAVASVVGNAIGVYVVAVCVALGVGAVVQRSASILTVLRYVGAAYLVWLGIQAFRHRRSFVPSLSGIPAPRNPIRAAREGFVVGVANPKAFLMFGAILPQFVHRAAGHVPVQMLLLSLAAFVIALVSDTVWAVAASAVRSWFARSPRRTELVGGAGGLSMVALGISVAVTGRKD
jgi:threonine/homoserine/homoserine lactone efflux protein